MLKQAIIVRTDLKMDKGKIAAQCAHASIASFLKTKETDRKEWLNEGMKKVILKVYNEKELINLYKITKKEKLPCELIIDAGLTQIKAGTLTALGIGPADDKKMDKTTGKLKLL